MNKIKGCNAIDKEWIKSISNSKWWAIRYDLSKEVLSDHQEDLLKLRDVLLNHGGEEVCLERIEDDIDNLLDINRSKLIVVDNINRSVRDSIYCYYDEIICAPSQCHSNSCYLYLDKSIQEDFDYNLKIMTGYALSGDGVWRQHSWCIIKNEDELDNDTIIETTEKRLAYYGFELDEAESEELCSWV